MAPLRSCSVFHTLLSVFIRMWAEWSLNSSRMWFRRRQRILGDGIYPIVLLCFVFFFKHVDLNIPCKYNFVLLISAGSSAQANSGNAVHQTHHLHASECACFTQRSSAPKINISLKTQHFGTIMLLRLCNNYLIKKKERFPLKDAYFSH